MLTILVASDLYGGIARDGGLPWYCSDDFRLFKELTENSPMICGSTTWDSMPFTVRERKVVVMSRSRLVPAWENARSVADAIRLATQHNQPSFVIGGANVYEQLFPYCHRIIRTVIPAYLDCDVSWDFDSELFLRERVDTLDSPVYIKYSEGGKYPIVGKATVEYWERRL